MTMMKMPYLFLGLRDKGLEQDLLLIAVMKSDERFNMAFGVHLGYWRLETDNDSYNVDMRPWIWD
jgi:hypothetical protein